MTNQPVWKLVYASDCEALYTDETGVYPPELAILDEIDDAKPGERFQVSRFPCERLTVEVGDYGRYGDMVTVRLSREWFTKRLAGVARSCGRSLLSLVRDLLSDDPRALASAYRDIAGCHGAINFDQYPETWSEYEASDWPERKDPEEDPDAYADCLAGEDHTREEFEEGYVSCALWCGVMAYRCATHTDTSDCTADCNPEMVSSSGHDESDLDDATTTQLKADANAFFTTHVIDLIACGLSMERAGHDFWLNRNRQGAGLWDDKGSDADKNAALDRLTTASRAYGSMDLVADSDGKVTVS